MHADDYLDSQGFNIIPVTISPTTEYSVVSCRFEHSRTHDEKYVRKKKRKKERERERERALTHEIDYR